MKTNNLLHLFRDEMNENRYMTVSISLQMKQQIEHLIINGSARMNVKFDFAEHEAMANVTYCKFQMKHLEQEEKGKVKSWHHMTENIFHITHFMNTFVSDEDDEWIDLSVFMQVKNDKTTADSQYFTLTNQAGKIIPGYSKSLLVVRKVGVKHYKFSFTICTVVDGIEYMDRFEFDIEIY